jgi:alkylhydroperoxidase/carboxymuconolactone decarboxylase family protein YurZ
MKRMSEDWKERKKEFEVLDVREMTGNFLPLILKKAEEKAVGDGLCVVQRFEPIPLYSALEDLGYEHVTEKESDTEYRVYFHRKESKGVETLAGTRVPLKPTAMVNFSNIDEELADITVKFWKLIWERDDPAIDQKTRYMLSLSNAVGAGRFRQATRELIKGYSIGLTVTEMDEMFEIFVWNQGVGNFASEIGPSPLFGAYQLIKKLEEKGRPREMIMDELVKRFGETNPAVGTSYRSRNG